MRKFIAAGLFGLALTGAAGAQEKPPLPAQPAAIAPVPVPLVQVSERRVALVIGNSKYKNTPALANPDHDASDVAESLKALGFEVIEGHDLEKASFDRSVREFAESLSGASAAVFFYAGHGLQVGGQNYLVPVDARLSTAVALDFEMVRLELVQRAMEREARTNIIILDACRDNPLARNLARALGTRSSSVGHGLAAVESGEGTLISFSTQPGNVALDGAGRNSPFADALLRHMSATGDDIAAVLINVRNDVMQATARKQVPWEHSALTARFYFKAPEPPKPAPPPGPTAEQQLEMLYWSTVKDSTNPAVIRSYLEKFPDGTFVPLARALIEQFEKQGEAEKAAKLEELKRIEAEQRRIDETKRAEEVRRLAADQRLEQLKRAEEQNRAEAARNSAELQQLSEKQKAAEAKQAEDLRKALEEARLAREAAQAAEKQRLAAIKGAEEARRALEASKAEAEKAIREIDQKPVPGEVKAAALSRQETQGAERSSGGGRYDGIWTIHNSGGSGCVSKSGSYNIQVENGRVKGLNKPGSGTVSASGHLSYTTQSTANGKPMPVSGTLSEKSGSGSYSVTGGRCTGSFIARKVSG